MANSKNLGTLNIVFLVLAAAAPLTVVSSGVTAAYATSGMSGVPLGYILCGVLVAIFSVGFTAMTKEIPNTAAFFSYVSAGLGKSHGLAASWLAIVSYSAMQIALYGLLGYTFTNLVYEVIGITIPWWVASLVALGIVALFGLRSAEATSKLLGILLFLEFCAVAFYCVVAFIGKPEPLAVSTLSATNLIGAGTGTLLAFTIAGFMGIESSAMYAEETRDPGKSVPRATLIAVAVITCFYSFSSWMIAQSVGEGNVVADARKQASDLFFNFLEIEGYGPLVPLVRGLLVTSLFSAITAFHNSIARYIMALGRERVVWSRLGMVDSRGVPVAGSIALSIFGFFALIVAVVAQAVGGFDDSFPAVVVFAWLSNAGGFGLVFLFLVTGISVLRFFSVRARPYSYWVTLVCPVVSGVGFAAIFVLILTNFNVLIGDSELWALVFVIPAIILSCGVAGFCRGEYLRRRNPAIYANIGSGRAPCLQ